jgi:cystathionine gamma-synthase
MAKGQMSTPFQHLPLGQRIPDSPHGVSVSLPRLRDVVDYEEKEPATMAKVCSGYPRFVKHPFLIDIARRFQAEKGPLQPIFFSTEDALDDALRCHSARHPVRPDSFLGIPMLAVKPGSPEELTYSRYLQHTGAGLSSREVEDCLITMGERNAPYAEETCNATTQQSIAAVRDWMQPSVPAEILLAKSGMNAFYAAFKAVQEIQAPKGRLDWISVGWLYLDTLQLLDHYLPQGAVHHALPAPHDTENLFDLIQSQGHRIAGLVLEAPTNPLVHTPEVARIGEACRKAGIATIMDPSLVSPRNVDLSPWCDALCCSLTKYAAHGGDVMIGALSVKRNGILGDDLVERIRRKLTAPYARDTWRLMAHLRTAPQVLNQINENTIQIAEALEGHPAIEKTLWAGMEGHRQHYRRLTHPNGGPGGVITIQLKQSLDHFYDHLPLPKGPSFGTSFSLVCAYIHLAHYDLIKDPACHARFHHAGLSERMVRLSIGTEDPEALKEVFYDALRN